MTKLIYNKNNNIKYEHIIFLICNFTLIFLAFNLFFTSEINSMDYYNEFNTIYNLNVDRFYEAHLANGRYFYTIVIYLINSLGIFTVSYETIYLTVHVVVGSILIYWLTFKIYNIVCENKVDTTNNNILLIKILINICLLFIYVNIFGVEWFLFSECLPMYTIAISASVLSAYFLVLSRHTYSCIISILLLFVAFNSYQISLSIFVAISIFMVCIKYKYRICIKLLLSLFNAFMVCVLNISFNYLITKILTINGVIGSGGRYDNISIWNALNNLKDFIEAQYGIWFETYDLLPHGTLLLSIIILMFFNRGIFKKGNIIKILIIFIQVIIVTLSVYAPISIQPYLYLSSRLLFPLMVSVSCLFLNIVFLNNFKNCKSSIIVIVLFLIINIIYINNYASNKYASTMMDHQYVRDIVYQIEMYEKNNNIKVNKMGITNDMNIQYTYQDVKYTKYPDLNRKNIVASWSDVQIFNYIFSNNYNEVTVPDSIFNEYFKGKDWNGFYPQEQLVFVGDTVYICLY